MHVIPIILTGGSGTRLWPLSRSTMPKQFLSLFGQETMLQLTIQRLEGIRGLENQHIALCNESHKFLVADQLKAIGINNPSIIVEPVSRNTAIAIYIASLQATLSREAKDTILLILPSDHLIKNKEKFRESVEEACNEAKKGKLVTLGITPDEPNTGYGYILKKDDGTTGVEKFIEKPSVDKAKEFSRDGRYLWNSGIFVFRADILQEEMSSYAKEIVDIGNKSFESSTSKNNFIELELEVFKNSPNTSIDYALMEHTDNASVVPMSAEWSDLGGWKELYDSQQKDVEGNVISGDVIQFNTKNSYINSSDKLVTTIGIEDLNIINTPDVLLIADKNRTDSNDIKNLVLHLEKSNRKEKDINRKVYRPWGWYDSLEQGSGFQVKRISVSPGCSISLQRHFHRSEHWVIVKGEGRITVDTDTFDLKENQSVYIPKEAIHRLENIRNTPVEIIEVQYGSYLGEDDIERFDDIFGRD